MSQSRVDLTVQSIVEQFKDYVRDGETLTLKRDLVVYEYGRSSNDPSYTGWNSDELSFPRAALEELCRLAQSSSSDEVSVETAGHYRDFGRTESIYTGSELNREFSNTRTVRLTLRIPQGPYLEIDGFTFRMKDLLELEKRRRELEEERRARAQGYNKD